jgi:hypothetical protein
MSPGRSPNLAIFNHDFLYPIMISPDLARERQIAGLVERPQHRAGHRGQRPHREPSLGVGQSGRPPVEVDIGPSQAKNFAATPASQDHDFGCRDHHRAHVVDHRILAWFKGGLHTEAG